MEVHCMRVCMCVRVGGAEQLLTMVDLCADKEERVQANVIMNELALHGS